MEYLAKILYEERDGDFWKYKVLNLETGENDWIHNHEKLNYFPSLPGKMTLFPNEDNQEKKFCQLFDQEIFNTAEEYQKAEDKLTLIQLQEELEKGIGEIDINSIKEKPKLTPQLTVRLRKLGITQKKLAIGYKVSIRTIRNLEKRVKNPNQKKKKRGRKQKITGFNLTLLKKFASQKDKKVALARTQIEMVEEYRKKGLELNQSTISRTLKRQGQSNKKAEKRYSELDIEKAKQFVFDNYDLYSYPYCFALDEFGFYSNEAPSFAYSRKGTRAEVIQPGEKGIRYTVILLVQNIEGQSEIKVNYKLIKNIKKKKGKSIKKGTRAVDLHDFLLGINFPKDKECFVLLDNAKIHHAVWTLIKEGRLPIKELAVKIGIILKYLPARAPMIQPAEFFINNIKGCIKKERPRTEEEVENVIKTVMENLRQKTLTENFRHCRDKLNVKPNYKRGK